MRPYVLYFMKNLKNKKNRRNVGTWGCGNRGPNFLNFLWKKKSLEMCEHRAVRPLRCGNIGLTLPWLQMMFRGISFKWFTRLLMGHEKALDKWNVLLKENLDLFFSNLTVRFPDNAYDSCLCGEIVQQAKADRDIQYLPTWVMTA